MEVKSAPAMDVVAGPPEDKSEPEQTKHEPAHHEPPKIHAAPKTRRDANVVAAIIATVIIVLGLAALVVFAYLKQTGSL